MTNGFTRMVLGIAALAALSLSALAPARADDDFKMLGVDDVEKMMKQPDVKVYDANPPDLWEKNHLPGATFIGAKKLASLLPADRSTKVVFYCAGPK